MRADSKLYEFVVLILRSARQPVMPDDHSELVPLLPIPNRTVKRLSADDSAGSRVKVGHRQALTALKSPIERLGFLINSEGIVSAMPWPRAAAGHRYGDGRYGKIFTVS